jgi:hypothetical protein
VWPGLQKFLQIIANKFSYFFARACSSLTSTIFPTENRVAPPPPSISCASVSGSRAWESTNWQLFTAFLLITTVLILLPRPIVTLVIATSAGKRLRAGLVTVAGTSSGNAVMLIALGLGWILTHALTWFEMVRFVGAAYLVWLGIQACGARPVCSLRRQSS